MSLRYWIVCIGFVLALLPAAPEAGAGVNKDLRDTKLATVELTSKLDLKAIEDAGGIIDHVKGNTADVYLRPEAFAELRARGFSIQWIRDEAVLYGRELWESTRHTANPLDDYHTNDEIQALFATWQTTYPTLFHYESIGLSGLSRNLWVCKLSDNVAADEAEIEVKYVANMHGDETVGKENCLRFIEELLTGYGGGDTTLTWMMNNYEMWFLPSMNPDGAAVPQRGNANGVDLNRDFPDRLIDSVNTAAGREIETGLVMAWTAAHNFVLSANFHGGALCVNYPWDGNPSGLSVYTACPDDSLFINASLRYSQYNSRLWASTEFTPHGITNGADWYHVNGGMQDWNYVWMGDREVTVELDNTKNPAVSRLEALWQENRLAMRNYWLEAQYGVRGLVTDSVTGLPLRANIQVGTNVYLTYSSALHGEYYRMLRPGTYTLTFSALGYATKTLSGVTVAGATPTVLNVALGSVPRADIAVSPSPLVESIDLCETRDVPFTIQNNGDAELDWSAEEAMTNFGGYGSATGAGWRFINSLQAGGPVYAWKDISGLGSAVAFGSDDQNLGPYNIGFSFPYYGSNFTTFRLSANGWLSFTSTASTQSSYANAFLPSGGAPENIVAPWWDDLSPQRSGTSVRYWSNNVDSLVVAFGNVQSYSGGGVYNFQMILQASGKITYQYGNMGTLRLNEATIGFQNAAKTRGLTVINNQAYIQNNLAIVCDPQPMIELIPASGSVAAGGFAVVTARLRSCLLPTGISTGTLAITSNDPTTPVLNVTVSLNKDIQMPDAVTDLTIFGEETGVTLGWSPAGFATGYKIYRSASYPVEASEANLIAITADTTYTDTPLPGNTAYYFVTSTR